MSTLVLTPETRVSSIAANYPASLRMMEALGLDYCCGGKLPLADAADKAGLSVDAAIAVLQAAITQDAPTGLERNWQTASLDALMAHIIETHHTYMHRELPRLAMLMERVLRAHGAHHGEMLEALSRQVTSLKEELEAHLRKEEEVTFPAIAHMISGHFDAAALETIAELQDEHEGAGAIIAAIRDITDDFTLPEDACNTFSALYQGLQEMEQDIHQHIHLENNILFPRVHCLGHSCGC
ncbi:MAG: iron-sulfur cluster repair di-iron protein [Armatimonadota bacterium]